MAWAGGAGNVGALISIYTSSGAPYSNYSIMGPKTQFFLRPPIR